MQQATIDIARDRTAPRAARRAVDAFGAGLDDGLVTDLRLLVSELITNAVKYGVGGIRLSLRSDDPRHVCAEVVDHGAGFVPVVRAGGADAVGGWGLHLVEALTKRWGVREGSTHVWFEIDRR